MQKRHPKQAAEERAQEPHKGEMAPVLDNGLWVRPNMKLRQEHGGAAGEPNRLAPADTQRFLELANIALGLGKSGNGRKKGKSVCNAAVVSRKKRQPGA